MQSSETQSQDRPLAPITDEPLTGRGDRGRLVLIILAILAFISLSEYLSTTLATVQLGLVMHGLALVALLLLAALVEDPGEQRVYLTLAFAPLIRLVSLSMPLQGLPVLYWYLLVSAPIIFSVIVVMRYGRFTLKEVGLTAKGWLLQLLVGLIGIGLGYIEYLILRPEPLADELSLRAIWFPALILVVFTGFLEEIIFRGLMQSALRAKIGRWLGILLISGLFAVLHLGYQSLLDVIFVFLVALLFALVTEWTRSILGVSLAHGLTNVTLFLVFPFIIGQGMQLQLPGIFTEWLTPTVQIMGELPTPASIEITPTAAQIIVDNRDPGFIHEGGQYWESEQGYQGHLVWALTRWKRPDVFITYQPEALVCGRYHFEVYIPADFGAAQSIRYAVAHRDGTTSVEIDQGAKQGGWADLGVFWCAVGQGCRVEVNNLTGRDYPVTFVAFDALRLTFIEGCP